ncbi:hypothetical protein SAMN05216167_1566 [Spirosoma endophyticum]|uniref:Uncharacterized protein n=1 Tax=Spirosoma endophyticum TaxID=662367 RepID=A0A1I2I7L5_9BACT|nr:hypothetical protein SAMN05216167_1566 [Spirosoma endophyticum]
MKTIEGVPDGWTLTYQEVSNNVYTVHLVTNFGSVVETTDSDDLDSIIAHCVESAREIENRTRLT